MVRVPGTPLPQLVTNYLLFGLFAATLLGIARYHKYAVQIAVTGLIGALIERPGFHLHLSARHNLRALARLQGIARPAAGARRRTHLHDDVTG